MGPPTSNKRKAGATAAAAPVAKQALSPGRKKQATGVAGSAHVIERYFAKQGPVTVDLVAMEVAAASGGEEPTNGDSTPNGSSSRQGRSNRTPTSYRDAEVIIDITRADSRSSNGTDGGLEGSIGTSSGVTMAISKVCIADVPAGEKLMVEGEGDSTKTALDNQPVVMPVPAVTPVSQVDDEDAPSAASAEAAAPRRATRGRAAKK